MGKRVGDAGALEDSSDGACGEVYVVMLCEQFGDMLAASALE